MMKCSRIAPCLVATLATWLTLGVQSAVAAGMYKWTDDKGAVHYSDQMPADAVNKGTTVFDKQGRPVKKIDAAPTPEQLKAIRPVMIHCHTVREDQLDEMEKLGIIPSFFNMHTYYWGDWHRDETLGKERAYRIEPTASVLKRKMIWTSHHDAPVAFPDSIRILYSCVTRKSRSGDVIGPDQRVSMAEALKALTINAAYQYGEESRKGSIEVGKIADFVVLSENPMKINPDKIMDLKVLETIKEGKSIYTAT